MTSATKAWGLDDQEFSNHNWSVAHQQCYCSSFSLTILCEQGITWARRAQPDFMPTAKGKHRPCLPHIKKGEWHWHICAPGASLNASCYSEQTSSKLQRESQSYREKWFPEVALKFPNDLKKTPFLSYRGSDKTYLESQHSGQDAHTCSSQQI